MDDAFDLSSFQKGMVVSFLPLGTILGCMVGGPVSDAIGRWKTIQIQNLLFVVGVLVISLASDVNSVYMGRFIVGIASALSAVADIPYLTEVSSPETRGRVTSAYEVLVVVGILVSFIVDLVLADTPNGWRWMFGIPGLFAAAQSLCMLWMPDSPKWLLEHNKRAEAEAALYCAYGDEALVARAIEEYDAQMAAQHASIERTYANLTGILGGDSTNPLNASAMTTSTSNSSSNGVSGDNRIKTSIVSGLSKTYQSLADSNTNIECGTKQSNILTNSEHSTMDTILLDASASASSGCNPVQQSVDFEVYTSHRRAADKALMRSYLPTVFVLILLLFFQQFTGGVVFRNYSSEILQGAGFSSHDSMIFTVLLGIFKVCITCWSIYNIDHLGRKPLLSYGCMMIGLGMLMYTIGFAMGVTKSIALYVVASCIITGGYSLGFGPVCWLLQSEMFPALIRGRGMGTSVIIGNIFQFIVNLLFLPAIDLVGKTGVFLFFALTSVVSLLYVRFILVETKGHEPDEMLAEINARLSLNCRTNSRSTEK